METSAASQQFVSLDPNSLKELVGSKNATAEQKNAVVSQQFESVLVKQFLNDVGLEWVFLYSGLLQMIVPVLMSMP